MGKGGPEAKGDGSLGNAKPPEEGWSDMMERWNKDNAKNMARYQAGRGFWGNIRSLPGIGRLLRIGR